MLDLKCLYFMNFLTCQAYIYSWIFGTFIFLIDFGDMIEIESVNYESTTLILIRNGTSL
jgi:hypothetical protein